VQILDTANRKPVRLIVVVAVDIGIAVVEVAIPSVVRIVLGRRPKVGVVRAIVEIATVPVARRRENNR